MRKPRAEVFKEKKLISVTEIFGFIDCRRYVYLQLTGKYIFKPTPEQQKLFDGGIRIHNYIQQEYPKTTQNKVLIEHRLEYNGVSGRVDIIEIYFFAGTNIADKIIVIEVKSSGEFGTYKLYPNQTKQAKTYGGIIGTIGLEGVKINDNTRIFCEVWKVPRDIDLKWGVVNKAIAKIPVGCDIYKTLDYAILQAVELKRCIKDGILPEKNKDACRKCGCKAICLIEENLYKEKLKYGKC